MRIPFFKKPSVKISISYLIIRTLYLLLSLLIISKCFLNINDDSYSVLLSILILAIPILTLIYTKYYNWEINFILISLFGILLRIFHVKGAGVTILVGSTFLCIASLLSGIKLYRVNKKDLFLKWFGLVKGFVVLICSLAVCFKFLRLQGGTLFLYIGSFSLALTIIGFIFRLPNSNYINWNNENRKQFYRTIVIPLLYIIALCTLILVFSDTWVAIMTIKSSTIPWGMDSIKLFSLEGI